MFQKQNEREENRHLGVWLQNDFKQTFTGTCQWLLDLQQQVGTKTLFPPLSEQLPNPSEPLISSIKQEQNNYHDSGRIWWDGRVPGKARGSGKPSLNPTVAWTWFKYGSLPTSMNGFLPLFKHSQRRLTFLPCCSHCWCVAFLRAIRSFHRGRDQLMLTTANCPPEWQGCDRGSAGRELGPNLTRWTTLCRGTWQQGSQSYESLAKFFHKESPLASWNVFSCCYFSFSKGPFLTLCGGFLII